MARRAAAHPVCTVAAAIATVTLLAAIAAALVLAPAPATRPHPTLEGSVGEVLTIAATNARTLIAPLLLCAGRWHTGCITRYLGDVVVAAIVIANAALVGVALGRYPSRLPAPTREMDALAAAIASAFQIPWQGAGLINHTANGYRMQLIYRADGHYDHVHFGVKAVGGHAARAAGALRVRQLRGRAADRATS